MIFQFEWVFARARLIAVLWIAATVILAVVSLSWGAEPLVVRPTLQLVTSAAKDQDDACIWVHPTDGAIPHGAFVCHTDQSPRPLLVTPWQEIDAKR